VLRRHGKSSPSHRHWGPSTFRAYHRVGGPASMLGLSNGRAALVAPKTTAAAALGLLSGISSVKTQLFRGAKE